MLPDFKYYYEVTEIRKRGTGIRIDIKMNETEEFRNRPKYMVNLF